jgi:hypothetical protein
VRQEYRYEWILAVYFWGSEVFDLILLLELQIREDGMYFPLRNDTRREGAERVLTNNSITLEDMLSNEEPYNYVLSSLSLYCAILGIPDFFNSTAHLEWLLGDIDFLKGEWYLSRKLALRIDFIRFRY